MTGCAVAAAQTPPLSDACAVKSRRGTPESLSSLWHVLAECSVERLHPVEAVGDVAELL